MSTPSEKVDLARAISDLQQQFQEQQQTLGQLRLSCTSYFIDTFIRGFPLIITVKDAVTGRVVFWNEKAEEVTGFSAREIVGKKLTDILPEHQALRLISGDQEVIDNRRPLTMDCQEISGAHGRKILSLVKTPVLLETSSPLIVTVAHDVTHQCELETETEMQRQFTQRC